MERKTGIAVLDHELAEEMASSLGRAGRRLEAALAALAAADAAARADALAEARDALWCYVVQRDVVGLSTDQAFLAAHRVPGEVSAGIAVERVVMRRRIPGLR